MYKIVQKYLVISTSIVKILLQALRWYYSLLILKILAMLQALVAYLNVREIFWVVPLGRLFIIVGWAWVSKYC